MYTAAQIIEDFRSDVFDRDVDDAGNPRDTLWSAEDVLRYLNEALAQVASDTLQHRKRLSIPVVAGEPLLHPPYTLFEVYRMDFKDGFSSRMLNQLDIDEGTVVDDYGIYSCEALDLDKQGSPRYYLRDYDVDAVRLWPVPVTAGTVVVFAAVSPEEIMDEGMPLPFSELKDRHLIRLWMKKLAYAKHDADTFDMTRSIEFGAEYAAMVLERADELDRDRRNGGVMRARAF